MIHLTHSLDHIAQAIKPFVQDELEQFHCGQMEKERLKQSLRNYAKLLCNIMLSERELYGVCRYFDLPKEDMRWLFPPEGR